MNVSAILLIILLFLMVIIGGEKGANSFLSLCLNFVTFFAMLMLITNQLDPIKVTIIGCIVISSMTLFIINGINNKSISSLLSVILVVILTMLLTYKMGTDANIQGFNIEQLEYIPIQTSGIPLNFSKVVFCEILLGLLGAIIDVSISISSSMNELYKNSLNITKSSLFKSGFNIGQDILGTMTNTLLFAYIGGFMTLIIRFVKLNYSILDMLNSKAFCSEVFQIMCCGIGIILIIPITAFISSTIIFLQSDRLKNDFFD
ncbi:YibE/F-like protein [Desulfosporosinus acidiphilus SJ4]|uniref:YibE/F-like protein n=1 Tax=Desulfosporosinus acidiphilus (strain DSM 22704 / JCM 16185 / SJ4) TaxID=646529 RepID=I4D422_DESAJ|nr:YibE/F family protein [Desulfosporosinus acidiphilus]AFM40546.1 YibE/F-like protein [Desulfosporosinus acidiphilus SJ4]